MKVRVFSGDNGHQKIGDKKGDWTLCYICFKTVYLCLKSYSKDTNFKFNLLIIYIMVIQGFGELDSKLF